MPTDLAPVTLRGQSQRLAFVIPQATNQLPVPEPDATSRVEVVLQTARTMHIAFDSATSGYGDNARMRLTRFVGSHVAHLAIGFGSLFAASAVGAITAAAMGAENTAGWIFGLGFGSSVGGGFATAIGLAIALGAQNARAKRKALPASATQPLRDRFDAPNSMPLERAVLAQLARVYLKDLGDRPVRGEAARAVLRDIIEREADLPETECSAANALMRCFLRIHDHRAVLKPSMTAEAAVKIEHDLARITDAPLRKAANDWLLGVLFDSDLCRAKLDGATENRLYRVLAGFEEPRAAKPAPQKGS